MTLEELDFPKSFFEDEVREGFFVSNMMKRNWAAQIQKFNIQIKKNKKNKKEKNFKIIIGQSL